MNSFDIKNIIETSGLKKTYIAQQCYIPLQRFSSFINGKGTLTENQKYRLYKFLDELAERQR